MILILQYYYFCLSLGNALCLNVKIPVNVNFKYGLVTSATV